MNNPNLIKSYQEVGIHLIYIYDGVCFFFTCVECGDAHE